MEDGVKDCHHYKNAVVERKYSQSSAHIEVPDAMCRVASVTKDTGDKEAGERKEYIDADETPWKQQVVIRKNQQKS